MRRIDPALQARLEPLLSTMGFELVGCEQLTAGRQILFRIYIDAPRGVTADDCAEVSRQVGAMLDVEDPFPGRYTLEVSSPGIDRPLFERKHFERFIGSEVRVRLQMPINKRRQYKGTLLRVEGEAIYLSLESGEEIMLPFSAVEKANLIGKI